MELKAVLEKKGKVVESGSRDELLWFDVLTTPLTQTDYESLEKDFKTAGIFAKVINAGHHTSKTGQEMQRVWLVAYKSQKELEDWQKEFEERTKRDHRYIGEQLDWFHNQEDIIGPGLPLMHMDGMVIREELINFIKELNSKMQAREVFTPHISKAELWKISGHYAHYKDKMFMWTQDDEEWGVKAMNCPMHTQIFAFKPRSYKDMPIRMAEFGTLYRKEQSGELHGLSRVWGFTQDDHHFFVTLNQIESEVNEIIKAAQVLYETFGMEYTFNLSTRPDDSMGEQKLWDVAEKSLKASLESAGLKYEVKEKEGAFYGPKIDIDVKDSMGRWWQLGTIQIDFFMPKNFKLTYIDKDDSRKTPVMIHFALLGSIERFMSVMIEHFSGRLPLWLNPKQVRVLPIGDSQFEYAKKLVNELRGLGVRAELESEGTLGKRIRNSQTQKVAVTLVVGDKELGEGTVSVRGQKEPMKFEDFKEKLLLAIMERSENL